MRSQPILIASAALAGRQLLTFLHGTAHQALQIPMGPWQSAFILSVIVIAPLLCLAALWTPYRCIAAQWAAISLTAGFAFGAFFHFGPQNPDHVMLAPQNSGGSLFVVTAALLLVVDAASAAVCAWAAWRFANEESSEPAMGR